MKSGEMIVYLVFVFGAIFGGTLHVKTETLQQTEKNLRQFSYNINKFENLIKKNGKEYSHTIYNTTSTDTKKQAIQKNCNNKLYVDNINPKKLIKTANIQLSEENLPLHKKVRRETSQLDEDDEASDITDDIKNKTFEKNTEELSTIREDSKSNELHLRRTGHYPGIDVDEGINDKKLLLLYPTRTTLNYSNVEEHNKKFHKTVHLKGRKFELLPFYGVFADENNVYNEDKDIPAREINEKTPIKGDFTNETKSNITETIYYEREGEYNERVENKDEVNDNLINTTSDLFYKIKKLVFDEEKSSLRNDFLDDSKQESKKYKEKGIQKNTKSAKDYDVFDTVSEKYKNMDLKPASDQEKYAESEKDSEKDESEKEEWSGFEFEKDKKIDEVLDKHRGKPAQLENYRDENVDTDKDTDVDVKPDVESNEKREEIEPKHDFSIASNRKAFDDEDSFDDLRLRDSVANYPIPQYHNRYSQGNVLPKEVLKRTTRDYSSRTRKLSHGIFVDEVARPHIDLEIIDDPDDKNKFKTSVNTNMLQDGETFSHPFYNEKERWNVAPKNENINMISTTEKDYKYYENDTKVTTGTLRINMVKQKTILNRIPSSVDKYLIKVFPTKKIPQYDKARQEMYMHRKIITPRTYHDEKLFTTESVEAAYVATKPIKNYLLKNKEKENKINLEHRYQMKLKKLDKSLPNSIKEHHLLKQFSPSVTLQETISNNTSTTAIQEVEYKATPPTFFKTTLKKIHNNPKFKFRKTQVIQKNKNYNKVHKTQTTTSSSSDTSLSSSSTSLSVIIETTLRTTTKKSIKKYPQKPKLGLITKKIFVSKTIASDKKDSKVDKHNFTSTTVSTNNTIHSLKHNTSTYIISVFNNTQHTKKVHSIDENAILNTSVTNGDYSSTVVTTRKIRVPNLEKSTSTKTPKIYETTLPIAYHDKVIPLTKSQREKNWKKKIHAGVKSPLNTATTTETEGEYKATPAQFVPYLPKNEKDSTLLNNNREEAKKNILYVPENLSYHVIPLNEAIRAKNTTESSKNLRLRIDPNLASTVGFYKHNELSVNKRPKGKVSIQVISTPKSLNPKPEPDEEGYGDYDDTLDHDDNIDDESIYTTESIIWTTSKTEYRIVQPKKSIMTERKPSANISRSVAENVLNILLKKKPIFSRKNIQNVSNDEAYSNKIMSLYKALIQTLLDVLLDKSTYNKTWYTIANSTENPRNETNILEDESVARLFDKTFSKGIYSNINVYYVDSTSETGENYSRPAQDTKYVEEFDFSNVEERDDKFDNEHLFGQSDGYKYDYPKTKTVVETILNIILNKSIASDNVNRTRKYPERNVSSSPMYINVVETVLMKFLNRSKNSTKGVFEKNTEKISTTSEQSADRLFIKEFYTNHTINNDANSTLYLKALPSNVTMYETSTGKEITLHVATYEDNKNNVNQNKTFPINETFHGANSNSTTLERFTQIDSHTEINQLRNETLLNTVTETALELTTDLKTVVNKPIIDVIDQTKTSPSTKEFISTGFTGKALSERINTLATTKLKHEEIEMPLFEIINFDKNVLHDSRSMTRSPLFDKEKPHTMSNTDDDLKSAAEETSLKLKQHLPKTNSPTFYKKYNLTLLVNGTIVAKTTVTETSVDASTMEIETMAYNNFLNSDATVTPIMDSETHVYDTDSVTYSQNDYISAKNYKINEHEDVIVKTTIKTDMKNENNILNENRTEKENITHETDSDKMNKELIKLLHQEFVNKTLIDDEINETTTLTKNVNMTSKSEISVANTTAVTIVKVANLSENKEFQNTTVTDIAEETYSQFKETVPAHHTIVNETTTNVAASAEYSINNNESKYNIEIKTSEVVDLKKSSMKPIDIMQSSTIPFLYKPDATNNSIRDLDNTFATLDNVLQGIKATQTWTLKAEDRQLDILPSEKTKNINEPYLGISSPATINIFLQNRSKLNGTLDETFASQTYYSVLPDKETPLENIFTNFVTTVKQKSEDNHSITPDPHVTTKSNDKLNSTLFDNEIFGARYSKNETYFNTMLSTEKSSQVSAIDTLINNSLSNIKNWNATAFAKDTYEDIEFLENEIRKDVNLLENKFKQIENKTESLHHTVTSTTEHISAISPLEIIKSATEYEVGPDTAEVFYNKIPLTQYCTKEVTSYNKSLNLEPTNILEYPTMSSATVKNVSVTNETKIMPFPVYSKKPIDEPPTTISNDNLIKVLQVILLNKTTISDNKSHEEPSCKLPSISPTIIESEGKNNVKYNTVTDKITYKELSNTSPSDSQTTQVFEYSNLENALRKELLNKILNPEVATDTVVSTQSTANGENLNFGYESIQYKELSNRLGNATHPIKVSIGATNLEKLFRNLLLNKTYNDGSPYLSYKYSTVSANSKDFEKSLPHLTHKGNKFGTKSQPEIVSHRGPNLEKNLQQLLLNRTLATDQPTEEYLPLTILPKLNPYEQLLSKLYWSILLENVAKRKQIPIAQLYPTEPFLVPNLPKYSDTILERPQVATKNYEMTTFKPYTDDAFEDRKIPIELNLLSDIVFSKKFAAKNTSQIPKEFQPNKAVVIADQISKTTMHELTTPDWLLQSYLDIKPATLSYFGDKTNTSEKLLNNISLLGKLYFTEFPLITYTPLITDQSSHATLAEARTQNPASTTLAHQEIISKVPDTKIDTERTTNITEKTPIAEEPTAMTQPMKKTGIKQAKLLIYEKPTTKIELEMTTNIFQKIPNNNWMPSAVYEKQPVLKKPIAAKDQFLYKTKVNTSNLSSNWRSLPVWPFQRFFYNKSNVNSYYEKRPANFKVSFKDEPVQNNTDKTNKTTFHLNVCGIDNAPLQNVKEGIDRVERYPWFGVLIYPKGRKERLVTTVVLITVQLVVASALDIDKLPKTNFRSCTKVVLGRNCTGPRIGVLNYNYHPDFRNGLYNSLALIQIDSAAIISKLRPICPPPKNLVGPTFYAMVMPEDCRSSNISVYEMIHVPAETCRRYYRIAGLDIESLWPRYVACGKVRYGGECVWRAGAVLLVKQDFKWHLLGFGVSGPGCEAPSRFVDYGMYYPWVARTVERMGQPAITKIAPNQLVFRRSVNQMQRFGPCDREEKKIELFTDSTEIEAPALESRHQAGMVQYNLTILSDVDYHCVILHAYNLKGLEHQHPPKLVLRRYCQNAPSYCFGGPGLIKFDFYLTIYFFTAIRYKIQVYGHETKSVDAKMLMRYANQKRDYPHVPIWGVRRSTRRFKFSKSLEKYKNSFTYDYHKKTGRRSRRKTMKKLNEEKRSQQRQKEERVKKKEVAKEKYKEDYRKQFNWRDDN